MKYASITDRLSGLGSAKWEVHFKGRAMKAAGADIIELTIGEPDMAPPADLLEVAVDAIRAGRYGYVDGRGEPKLIRALADRYSKRSGREIAPEQILSFPGTQTALYAIFTALLEPGDEVLVGDPMYATYEAVIASPGGRMVPVPLRPEHGFRMQAADVEARITPRSRVLFLNTPHNPTGAVLTADDIAALGEVARKHDLWIVSDEVYEELTFDGVPFVSPLSFPDLADRVIVASSISKSHAAPGFRAGWALGPVEFGMRALPLSESMLFSAPPFISDMTAQAVSAPSPIAAEMAARFQARAAILHQRLSGVGGLVLNRPEAGMFALMDVRATGMSGRDFALDLLENGGVSVMPGESFGAALNGWVRIGLTQPDELTSQAADRIAKHVSKGKSA